MKSLMCSILFLLLFSARLAAQFPATITAVWDPLPATGNLFTDAVSYTLTFNGFTFSIPAANCTVTECRQILSVPSAGNYTITVAGKNVLGMLGDTTSLIFDASTPGKSGNLRIRVQ